MISLRREERGCGGCRKLKVVDESRLRWLRKRLDGYRVCKKKEGSKCEKVLLWTARKIENGRSCKKEDDSRRPDR